MTSFGDGYCWACGNPFRIGPNDVTTHLTVDGEVDYDSDADHAAY